VEYDELKRWIEEEISFCERQIEIYRNRLERALKIKRELEKIGEVRAERENISKRLETQEVKVRSRRRYRDVMDEVKSIIVSMGAKFQAVPRDEIIKRAVERGIPEREVQSVLRALISEGKLFEPREKMIRMIH